MVTGFNTEIEHEGRVFHVQTEDKGLENPVVETLIYCRGAIVTSERRSYGDLLEAGSYSEADLQERMERQHQGQLREIRNGRYDSDGQMPFGYRTVTNRPFDEVVLAFLREHGQSGAIKCRLLDWQVLYEGTRPTLRMTVVNPMSEAPMAGAHVTVRVEGSGRRPVELFSADADDDGFVEASFLIPEAAGGGEIVCTAQLGSARDEHRQRVKKGSPSPISA